MLHLILPLKQRPNYLNYIPFKLGSCISGDLSTNATKTDLRWIEMQLLSNH